MEKLTQKVIESPNACITQVDTVVYRRKSVTFLMIIFLKACSYVIPIDWSFDIEFFASKVEFTAQD